MRPAWTARPAQTPRPNRSKPHNPPRRAVRHRLDHGRADPCPRRGRLAALGWAVGAVRPLGAFHHVPPHRPRCDRRLPPPPHPPLLSHLPDRPHLLCDPRLRLSRGSGDRLGGPTPPPPPFLRPGGGPPQPPRRPRRRDPRNPARPCPRPPRLALHRPGPHRPPALRPRPPRRPV